MMERINRHDLENLIYNEEMIGSTSELYNCMFNGKTFLYKKLDIFFHDQVNLFDKLSEVDENFLNIPKHLIVNSYNRPVGYLVEPYKDYKSLFDTNESPSLSTSMKIKILMDAKEKIIRMHKHNIIHCDLHSANIMCKGTDTKIIDFDFCSYQYSTPCSYHPFSYKYFQTNPLTYSIDIFMFNITTISLLYDVAFPNVFNSEQIIDSKLQENDHRRIWQKVKEKKELTYNDFLINYY